MNSNRTKGTLALALAILICGAVMPAALAESGIYVNDSLTTLSGSIGEAYAIGGDGSVSIVAGVPAYAMTGSGTALIGDSPAQPSAQPSLPVGGSNITVKTDIARIGLNYYYSSSRDSSLSTATLTNYVGSGFKFGYYDSSRRFQQLGTTSEASITMSVESGKVVVKKSGGGAALYTSDSSNALAVEPISSSKAETTFGSYRYYGGFEFRIVNAGKMTVVNVLPVEDYIKGVVPYEMSPSWPIEALKAQALCARTYYMSNYNTYSSYGFDVTDDTYCQAYLGINRATATTDEAVDKTAGQYVTYNGSLASTYYFSSDGGATESSENVWVAALPYLRGKLDPYEAAVDFTYKTWSVTLTGAQVASKLINKGYSVGEIVSITPAYTDVGNILSLTYTDSGGKSLTISKAAAYQSLGLNSCRFTVTYSEGSYVFNGGGWGHNVGMSQWGAYSMAKVYGMTYDQIIGFYFTGVDISLGKLG